ncbi:MAG: hypothetical protein LAT62_14870 [Natronospirillum sp.]|uniref:hypothetical protein n=1 Tax=Natronospirillum sp. TaxID=2812955 RepID=UPI0025CCAAB6|nr:hypothetical protein [Natronospirillum sp.]MCH8553218.1 hypothetical protein [Natronospirillum sp.]
MSNRLSIQVVRNQRYKHSEPEFGWVAQDDYAQSFLMAGDSEDQFYSRYPTEDSLIEAVRNDPAFDNFGEADEDEESTIARITVEGYDREG